MSLTTISRILGGLLGVAAVSMTQANQVAPKSITQSGQKHQDQEQKKITVDYVGEIPKTSDPFSDNTHVFRVTVPRSIAQIRINPDNPSGHAPWYTDVYLNQMQDDDQHYLGRLFSNAGIQTGITSEYGLGKLAQPVYSANQFYFTADDVPKRIILLGQSAPNDLKGLRKQSHLQLETPFVTAVSIDPEVIQKAKDQKYDCQNPSHCTVILNKANADQPAKLVNNGADPWPFKIQIKNTFSGQVLKSNESAYQHIVFFDDDGNFKQTAESLVTNLHNKDQGNDLMILPSKAANIKTAPYNNHSADGSPVYGRNSVSNGKNSQGYYAYSMGSDIKAHIVAGIATENGLGDIKDPSKQDISVKKLPHNPIHNVKRNFGGKRKDLDNEAKHKFTHFSFSKTASDILDGGQVKFANPDTNYPNYLVFDDGVYLYDNTTMGICDNSSKSFGPTDSEKYFCQDHTNYAWGWFSWGVNSSNKKRLDEIYISDGQFLHPSKSSDYNRLINDGTDFESIYQGKNYTNYGNQKLAFDINGYPYQWNASSDESKEAKNSRHNEVKDHEVTDYDHYGYHYDGEVFQNHLQFDVMMFQRHHYKSFRINGPDLHSGFIIPPKGIEKIYVDTGDNHLDDLLSNKNKKYDFFASINGVYIPLVELMFHPSYIHRDHGFDQDIYTLFDYGAPGQKAYDKITPSIFSMDTAPHSERHMDPNGIGDYHMYDTIFKLNNKGMPDRSILTVLNTSNDKVKFQVTGGRSTELDTINWEGGTLKDNQAKVVGLFKKGEPKNQEELKFTVNNLTGYIFFKQGQDPSCQLGGIIGEMTSYCSVKKQDNTYPTTYVLDIKQSDIHGYDIKTFSKDHKMSLDHAGDVVHGKYYTLKLVPWDGPSPKGDFSSYDLVLETNKGMEGGPKRIIWRASDELDKSKFKDFRGFLQVYLDYHVLLVTIQGKLSGFPHRRAPKADHVVVGDVNGLAVYDKDDNLLWEALP